jgi:hypothetical protein
MASIKELSYEQNFYWQGTQYRQVIRPKRPRGPFKIYACDVTLSNYNAVEMPSGRKVKPVLRIFNEAN